MHIYQGDGIILSVADCDGDQRIVNIVNSVLEENYSDLCDVDNSMMFGVYESSDNILSARRGDMELDTSQGIIILPMSPDGEFEQSNTPDILWELGIYWMSAISSYYVECEQ